MQLPLGKELHTGCRKGNLHRLGESAYEFRVKVYDDCLLSRSSLDSNPKASTNW